MKPQTDSTEKLLIIITTLLLLLTFIPRFYDILKFLPDYNIDENDIVEFAVGFMGGDLDPHWYKYGPLYAYILSIIYFIQSVFYTGSLDNFVQDIFFNCTKFYYTARFVNSCVYLILAYFTYKLAKKYFNSKIALIALFIAIFPFCDRLNYFKIRVDTLLALWSILAMYFSLRVFETGKLKNYLLTGLFWGLGLATKPLPALLILPSIFSAHFFGFKKDKVFTVHKAKQIKNLTTDKTNKSKQTLLKNFGYSIVNKKIYIFLIAGIVTNFLVHPYSFINFEGYKREQFQAILSEGSKNFTPGSDITRFFPAFGYVFTVVSIIAVIYMVYKLIKGKNALYLILVSYPVIFWLVFAKGAARNYFYIPIIPFLIIFIAKFIFDVSQRVKNNIFKSAVICLLLVVIILQPAIGQINTTLKLNSCENYKELHTALAAKHWIEANISQDSKILLYGYYTALPRLVDSNPNKQAQLGEYFMYQRWKNEFLKEQFLKAHKLYVEGENPTFNLFNSLEFTYKQKKYFWRLRNRAQDIEKYLFSVTKSLSFDYIISYYNLTKYPEFESSVFKVFDKSDYPFGSPITIYKVK